MCDFKGINNASQMEKWKKINSVCMTSILSSLLASCGIWQRWRQYSLQC